MNGSVQVPGPGSAMALFAAVAIYTAGFADLSGGFRMAFLGVAIGGIILTLIIEWLHRSDDEEE